jgi:hypothetical protein
MLSLLPRQKRKDSKKRASTEPGAVHSSSMTCTTLQALAVIVIDSYASASTSAAILSAASSCNAGIACEYVSSEIDTVA